VAHTVGLKSVYC